MAVPEGVPGGVPGMAVPGGVTGGVPGATPGAGVVGNKALRPRHKTPRMDARNGADESQCCFGAFDGNGFGRVTTVFLICLLGQISVRLGRGTSTKASFDIVIPKVILCMMLQ